jgi:vitamin B12 transporter
MPARVVFAALLALAFSAKESRAAGAPTVLEPFVSAATRTPAERETIGSVVETFTAQDLSRRQVSSLAAALAGGTAAPLFASGAHGAITSLFLRGANSNQTLFLVDGLRVNDPNTDYSVLLGGACVAACDRLEVAHGPQSTLYGGEAVGGVVVLQSERGAGAAGGRVAVEAGSFGTVQGLVTGQGERGPTAWNFALQGGRTENERPNNDFASANFTLRIDRTVNERVAIGSTLRWFHGDYGSPGTRFTNDPDNREREDNVLATAFADVKPGPAWTGRIVLGGQDRHYTAESPRAGRPTEVTVVRNRRAIFDAQTSFTGIERHRVTGGLLAEANHTRNTGFGNINQRQGLLAFFAQDEWAARDNLYLTLGARSDDFDTFGRATTGRATFAWLVQPNVKLRASYGTAFRSPSFLDLYGQSAFYAGNPALRPERAKGWDAGLDYYLPGGRGELRATCFDTAFRDLIASTPNFRSVENIQRARTRGLELAAQVRLPAAIEARASFTYLEADNLTTGLRLLRRPRQAASVDLIRTWSHGVTMGVGAAAVAARRDVNARTFAQIDGEDYTVVRLHAAWAISPQLALKARLENAGNERYEEVNGYPALGFGAFGGVEWKF